MIGTKVGRYIWTACAAGWVVLAVVTGVEMAAVVALGCIAIAFLWR